jgi:hypothetical protein
MIYCSKPYFLYLGVVKKRKQIALDFEIDKLTNSIENTISGDSFATDITLLTLPEAKKLSKRNGWRFNWVYEIKQPERDVFKLTVVNNPEVIQGVVSLEVKKDHVFMHLIESAPFNIGKKKVYYGVPANLVAYACKLSFQRGGEGYVSFLSKTRLVNHYHETLGAKHLGGNLMALDTVSALKLVNKYF